MKNYCVDDAEWCVLVDRKKAEKIIQSATGKICSPNGSFPDELTVFHVEPYQRFLDVPPHARWQLLKRGLTAEEAWDEWLECDQEKIREILLRHVSSFVPIVGETISIKNTLRFDILKRDGYKCRICGRGAEDGVKLEVDHIQPKSNGGKDFADNLWTLCFNCNRGKSIKPLIEVTP